VIPEYVDDVIDEFVQVDPHLGGAHWDGSIEHIEGIRASRRAGGGRGIENRSELKVNISRIRQIVPSVLYTISIGDPKWLTYERSFEGTPLVQLHWFDGPRCSRILTEGWREVEIWDPGWRGGVCQTEAIGMSL